MPSFYGNQGRTIRPVRPVSSFLAVLFVLWLFPGAVCAQETETITSRVLLWAHRGLTSRAPENSLAAIKAAHDLGLQGCEVDVRTTADGHLVLMHDPTVDRTTSGKGLLKDYSLQKLQGLVLSNLRNEPTNHFPPALVQALELISPWTGFELTLDLKEADPIKAGRLVLAKKLSGRVTFSVGGPDRVESAVALRALDPRLRISLDPGWWWKVEGVPAFMIKALKATDIFAAEWYFPQRGFGEARRAGARVSVYLWGEKDLLARAKRALALGAQGISCDHPRLLLPLLNSKRGVKTP